MELQKVEPSQRRYVAEEHTFEGYGFGSTSSHLNSLLHGCCGVSSFSSPQPQMHGTP